MEFVLNLIKYAVVAQLVERFLPKEKVAGSIPVRRSKKETSAGVTQGQSSCFVNSKSWVRFPPPAPESGGGREPTNGKV